MVVGYTCYGMIVVTETSKRLNLCYAAGLQGNTVLTKYWITFLAGTGDLFRRNNMNYFISFFLGIIAGLLCQILNKMG